MSKELEVVRKLQHCGVEEYRITLEKVEKILLEYEQIKNAKPSEALNKLLDRANHDEYLGRIGTKEAEQFLNENQAFATTIKQALLKSQEQEKENTEYKQLEEQLGCPLEVVFKALRYGFYTISSDKLQLFKECDNRIVFIRHLGYDIEICCEQAKNEIHSKCEMFLERSTKDYQKTWWLKKDKSE